MRENHALWKLARYNWIYHLLVQMSLHDPKESKFVDGNIPAWLDKEKLEAAGKMLSIYQVVHVNEVQVIKFDSKGIRKAEF